MDCINSIENEEKLLTSMIEARRIAINKLTKENESLPKRLEEYLTAILGSKENAKKEEVELHTKAFMERNEYILLDPLKISTRIEALDEKITNFKAEVDAVLSESNALTTVNV